MKHNASPVHEALITSTEKLLGGSWQRFGFLDTLRFAVIPKFTNHEDWPGVTAAQHYEDWLPQFRGHIPDAHSIDADKRLVRLIEVGQFDESKLQALCENCCLLDFQGWTVELYQVDKLTGVVLRLRDALWLACILHERAVGRNLANHPAGWGVCREGSSGLHLPTAAAYVRREGSPLAPGTSHGYYGSLPRSNCTLTYPNVSCSIQGSDWWYSWSYSDGK